MMASNTSCRICDDGTESDWIMTARSEATGFPAGETFYICDAHLIGLCLSKVLDSEAAAAAATEAQEAAHGEEEPTVPQPAPKTVRGRKRASQANGDTPATTEEAAADVDR